MQVRFYATKKDQSELIAYAISKGFALVPRVQPAAEEITVHGLKDWKEVAGDAPYKLLLLAPGFTGEDCTKNPIESDPDLIVVSPRNSPVVELILNRTRAVQNEQRIYFKYGRNLPRHDECLKSFNALARWICKWVKSNQRSVWLGPELAQQLADDQAEIYLLGELLKPATRGSW